ncbi:transcriptional regulator [Neobacillus notoginsengisoli]|uniref:Transcriptional regulator n=1 Tax=Neobacillus notoginsengisoli TaxID=1578198 RepID=A0A417YRD7_9BACI|nr:LCP family protein [Neobacillus notoginsengisoli]RHW37277.1 transcriptional regulator [Neobacillus notoginsengisoli]
MNSRISKRSRRKVRKMRVFLSFIVLFLLGGGLIYGYEFIDKTSKASKQIFKPSKNTAEREIEIAKDPFSVLLVGIENMEGGKGRSDVLLLATVNPAKEEIYMVSIPRDTRTFLPEAGYETKINHSYGYDEVNSTIAAVNRLIDVPIDYYITTNFDGFEDVVDTLNGIEVNVPFTFKAQLTGSLKWKTYYEGPMKLNGNEALAYVRMRKSDPQGDHGRNQRQQQVIKEIIKKSTSFSSLTKLDDLIADLGENVTTNIPPSKFLSFAKLYTKIKNTEIQNLKIEGKDEQVNSVWFFYPDEDSLKTISDTLNASLGTSYGNQLTSDDPIEPDSAFDDGLGSTQ